MSETFFSFRHLEKSGDLIRLSSSCTVRSNVTAFACTYLKNAIAGFPANGEAMTVVLEQTIPETLKKRLGTVYRDHPESYMVLADAEQRTVSLYAPTHRGLIYAVSTLIQLEDDGVLTERLFLFDYPDMKLRGYHVFTPGRAYFPEFKAAIDQLVYYKYNAVTIEVGGAMEYKRHPEINEKWAEFCNEIASGSQEAFRICGSYPWQKNCIHFDNGNGGFITQEEMLELVRYCRERELLVFPEVPSLSHSDYIVRAHPELNERVEDAYPDTYCPSNPKSYEILFDIIDEVVGVFQPEYLCIGHDEMYTLALCERCRGKSPVDLYVGDIVTINDYLKTKHIKTLMWADRLFGGPQGNGDPEKGVPNLIECRGKIPTDVILLNWAWPGTDHSEEELLNEMGYQMIFGNFDGLSRKRYRECFHLNQGGFISNWGSFEKKYMQRNLQYYGLSNTAYIFWNGDYTDSDVPFVLEKMRRKLYGDYRKALGDSVIELCHTTDPEIEYGWFYDGRFINDSDWLLGNHTVRYTDGTEVKLPVIYGYNIRGCRAESEETFRNDCSGRAVEAVGASYPFWKDGKVWYQAAYANPYPEKEILEIIPAENIPMFTEKVL